MPLRILIVEDEPPIALLEAKAVEKAGHSARTVSYGAEALCTLEADVFDMVLLDHQLPDMSGNEILVEILGRFPAMPVIMVTGHGDESLAVEVMKAGAKDYIVKDFASKYLTDLPKIISRNYEKSLLELRLKEKETALQESEERYRTLVEEAPDMIHCLDAEGKITDANKVELETMGYSREEYIGKPLLEIIHPGYLEVTKKAWASTMSGHVTRKYETALITKAGCKVDVEVSVTPRIVDGKGVSTRAIIRDITERKQAEDILRSSRAKLAEAQRIGHMGNWEFDVIQDKGLFSDETYRIFGVADDYGVSFKSFIRFVHPDDRWLVKQANREAFRTGSFSNLQYRIVHPDGSVCFVQASGEAQRDKSGRPNRIFGTIQDITERKLAEEQVQSQARRMHALRQALEMLNRAGSVYEVYEFAVQGVMNVLGCGRASILVFGVDNRVHFAAWHGLSEGYRKAVNGHCPWQRHEIDAEPICMPDIAKADLPEDLRSIILGEGARAAAFFPLVASDRLLGKYMAYFNQPHELSGEEIDFGKILADNLVTALNRLEHVRQLNLSEQRLTLAMEGTSDGLWDRNIQTGEAYFSPRWETMLGYDVGEVEPKMSSWKKMIHPDDMNNVMAVLTEHIEGRSDQYVSESRLRAKDGSWLWILGRGKVVEWDADGKPLRITGTHTDITKRKEADELVRKLSHAIEQAGESVVITNREGIIEYANPAFTSITGYSAEETIGQTPRLLKSGSQDAAFYEEVWKTIINGTVWNGKVTDRRKDGSFYPAMLTISPIKDKSGDITHFVGLQSDLSKLEDMEHRFYQAQKMETVGVMVGGIAHNFNNILAGMTGNLYLAKKSMGENPGAVRRLDNVEELSHHAAEMIQQLLAFARKGMVSVKELPLTPCIRETLKLLQASVPENIAVRQDICSDDLQVMGDGTQLHQVLVNLVNNARDAVEDVDNPNITIRLEPFDADDAFIESHPYFKTCSYAHLSIADNGIGIPEHQLEHLFEPFFTTKEEGQGTGLGLSMVFGAIKTHHGFVEVDSIEGEGSTFHVYIPLLEAENIAVDIASKVETAKGRGELILLADDEQMVRVVMAEVLESLGYQVLLAEDGMEALELYRTHQQDIALALLDVVMPHCGGMQLARRIREINPDLPVIFLTGYDKAHALGGEAQIPHAEAFSKPVNFDLLSQRIRTMLD